MESVPRRFCVTFKNTLNILQHRSSLQKTRCVHQNCLRSYATKPNLKSPKSDSSYVLLVIPIVTFGLGTWQVQRRKWKLGLIADLEAKTLALPIPFPLNTEELQDLEYRKVTVRGTFDHDRESHVAPRTLIVGGEDGQGGLMGGRTKSGAHVITPFKLADRDITILVNRGWVSREKTDPSKRPAGQVQEEIEFNGVVRRSEKVGQCRNEPEKNIWFTRDIEEMAHWLQTAPILLDADAKSTVPGGPQGGQTRVTLRNEHLSYIFTWYSLSALTGILWARRYWMRR